jgi:Bifunctional DNA primase/polymerase, N-terminal
VHPLAPGRKAPAANCPLCRDGSHPPNVCPCHKRGRWCHGFHAATTDRERIDRWWDESGEWGVGVSCGPAGLVVIDVDAHRGEPPERAFLLPGIAIDPRVDLEGLESGFDTLALLAAYRREPNPAEDSSTLRVRTPSGGLHIWYRVRGEQRYRSSAGSSRKVALAWQVDVRAESGYVVAPGVRTASGRYEALGSTREPAVLPEWLAAELVRTGHVLDSPVQNTDEDCVQVVAQRVPRLAGGKGPRILGPLLAEVEACGAVSEGAGFAEKLNRAAFTAGGLVAAGHMGEQEARAALTAAAGRARPSQEGRNVRIIAAGFHAGTRHPFRMAVGRTSGEGSR